MKRERMRACRNTGLNKKFQKWVLFDTYLCGQFFEMHGQNLIGYATLVTTTNYRFLGSERKVDRVPNLAKWLFFTGSVSPPQQSPPEFPPGPPPKPPFFTDILEPPVLLYSLLVYYDCGLLFF